MMSFLALLCRNIAIEKRKITTRLLKGALGELLLSKWPSLMKGLHFVQKVLLASA